MPMSPRLLRPRASGAFTPRSLSGLAAWFDADDASTITLNGSTVSEWRDKSGNNRHATQATAARQPTYTTNSLNGKPALTALGETIANRAMTVAAFPFSNAHTAMFVFRASALNQTIFLRGPNLNDQPRATVSGSPLTFGAFKGGFSQGQVSSTIAYPASQWSIAGVINNVSLLRGYLNGVYGTAATANTESWSGNSALRLFSLSDTLHTLNGGIAEFIYYDRQLTASEVERVALYLSRKWNISLAPQVSNADAQDWINRVYSNGGTVSTSTAAAVNTFCNSIDAAGIRDRFYRLNLFCGNSDASLNAVRTPLYRGQSLAGTQLGGTTDTNVNFVQGDYAETGASGGLDGNGSTKYLNTGLAANSTAYGERHLCVYEIAKSPNAFDISIGARSSSPATYFEMTTFNPASTFAFRSSDAVTSASESGYTAAGAMMMGVHPSTHTGVLYRNGASVGTANFASRTNSYSGNVFVFAGNSDGSPSDHADIRLGGYSIGLAMTAAQALAYYNTMQAFQAALSRSV